MSTNFTPQQRQMIEDMSKWDSLPQNVRNLLAEQIGPSTWDTLPPGTPVEVTHNVNDVLHTYITYTHPAADGRIKIAKRDGDGRVASAWMNKASIESVTVLQPADDTGDTGDHITISDGFYILHSPAQAAPLGTGGANRAYSIPRRRMVDLGSVAAGRDDVYPLVWRYGTAYGSDEAQAAYNKTQNADLFLPPDAKRTTWNGVEYVLLDTQDLVDAYAAKYGNEVTGLDDAGDPEQMNPDSTSYRPWVARADGQDMDSTERAETGYPLVRELRNQ